MVEVCHKGCNDVCEVGKCEMLVPLNSRVSMRKMASLVIEILGSEEVIVTSKPQGRLLNVFIILAKWLGIKVLERAP